MSQAQKAPEAGMEDLLASIRKAIREDSAANPRDASGESHSAAGGPRPEILELRNRIAGQLAERTPASPPRAPGFAGILSGDVGLLSPPSASEARRSGEGLRQTY